MKKNPKEIILLLIIAFIFILELIKYKLFNIEFNHLNIVLREVIIIIIYFINIIKLRNYKKINVFINVGLIILAILSLLFTSFNGIGFLLFFIFLLLITLDVMVSTENNFEISLVTSVSSLILLFVALGILNLLTWSPLFLIIIVAISVFYLLKNKSKMIKSIKSINIKSVIIFSMLFIVAILGGVGRYVHKWDEYSYWAYAAKVCINENSLYAVISRLGVTKTYPPVSTIWHYLISVFSGYSEPNLYIGLSILTFIYMMPLFSKLNTKKTFTIIAFVLTCIYFPILFNGSITYSLLYVDLLLASLCSCALIVHSQTRENKKLNPCLIIILIMITFLKTNGFVFSCSLLLLFYLKDLLENKISIKNIFVRVKKYVLPLITVLGLYILWRIFANSIDSIAYDFVLLPDSLKADLLPKLEPQFLLDFFNSLVVSVDESIIHSFIEIPSFAYLIIVLCGIYYVEHNKSIIKTLTPYVLSYIAFFFLTALSLFVMFSKYEASTLASFGRYLAPINIALALYVLYKLSTKKEEKLLNVMCIIIICLVGFSNTTFFLTDIRTRRDTVHTMEARTETFKEVVNNTEATDKIFIINQADTDTIMPLWYARYYCYPRIVNSSSNAITWKIKTESNEWDLQDWGLTADNFERHLVEEKFDYVYLYSTTEEFFVELQNTFENLDDAKNYKLFKVEKVDTTNVQLIPVKNEE